MDSEGDPFVTSEEEEYHQIIQELAKKKTECESSLEELRQKAARLVTRQPVDVGNSSVGTPSFGGGDSPSWPPGNSSFVEGSSGNHTGFAANSTETNVKECLSTHDCPPVRDCPPV